MEVMKNGENDEMWWKIVKTFIIKKFQTDKKIFKP